MSQSIFNSDGFILSLIRQDCLIYYLRQNNQSRWILVFLTSKMESGTNLRKETETNSGYDSCLWYVTDAGERIRFLEYYLSEIATEMDCFWLFCLNYLGGSEAPLCAVCNA